MIHRHVCSGFCGRLTEEKGQGLAQRDEGDTAADGEHDGLLDVLVAVLHLEIDVEGADEYDDGGDGFHQIGDGGLVGCYLLGGLGETGGSFAGRHSVANGQCEGAKREYALAGKSCVAEACHGTQTFVLDVVHV